MSQPTHRLVAISKEASKNRQYDQQFEIGACWESKLEGALNVKIGGNRDFEEVYVVTVDKAGKKRKVSAEDFFFTLWTNRPKQNRDGQDMPEDDDF